MADKLSKKLEKIRLAALNAAEDEENEENEEGEDEEDEEFEAEPFRPLTKFEMYRMNALRKIDEGRDAIDVEYQKERVALEAKYITLRQPLFDDRANIISGTKDVPQVDDEMTAEAKGKPGNQMREVTTYLIIMSHSYPPPFIASDKDDGISKFWLGVLSQSGVRENITADDMPVLEHLTDITTTYNEDFTSFTLHLFFAENDFFTNRELTKTYVLDENVFHEEPGLQDISFSPIEWKAGKSVCEKEVKKVQKMKSGKNKGQKRTIVQMQPQRSFFNWFSEPEEPNEEDEEDEEKEYVKFDEETDYDLAHYLRTLVIPDATKIFMGEMQTYDDEDDMGDEEDDEDEDEDEEDDEDERPQQKGGKRGKAAIAPGVGAAIAPGFGLPPPPGDANAPPECKQN